MHKSFSTFLREAEIKRTLTDTQHQELMRLFVSEFFLAAQRILHQNIDMEQQDVEWQRIPVSVMDAELRTVVRNALLRYRTTDYAPAGRGTSITDAMSDVVAFRLDTSESEVSANWGNYNPLYIIVPAWELVIYFPQVKTPGVAKLFRIQGRYISMDPVKVQTNELEILNPFRLQMVKMSQQPKNFNSK